MRDVDSTVSFEAMRLQAVLETSPVAFSYFDSSDRLVYWNTAYEDLNFRIRHLIFRGAYFPDLLAELVASDQIRIRGSTSDWIRKRLFARRTGETAFRGLADGRTFLVQERKDEIGGTLGFWLDISDLFADGLLKSDGARLSGAADGPLDSHGIQDAVRNQMQVVLGNLELLRAGECGPDQEPYVDDALRAARIITVLLDSTRD